MDDGPETLGGMVLLLVAILLILLFVVFVQQ